MSRVILSAVVLFSVALIVFAARLDTKLPEIWSEDLEVPPTRVPVVETAISGHQNVDLMLRFDNAKQLRSGLLAGMVTDTIYSPGDLINCGDPVLEVDGVLRPLFCGPKPLWRSIGRDEAGPDVEALRYFLQSLGFDPGSGATDGVDSDLRRAISSYRKQYGLPRGSLFEPSFVVYAADPTQVGEIVSAEGGFIDADQVLAEVAPRIIEARFSVETRLSGRKHVVVVEGTPVEVELTSIGGSVVDLNLLNEVLAGIDVTDAPEAISVDFGLAEPLPVYSVPAGALISDNGLFCLIEADTSKIRRVELIDSFTGTVFFEPVQELAGSEVEMNLVSGRSEC